MQFDNAFEVPLPPAEAWPLLMDVARIAPCMPGAELTEVLGNDSYKGRISVRLGPVALTFAGLVVFEAVDAENHTARVRAQGTDAKGRGGAQATAAFRLEPAPAGTRVSVHTDLTLSGAVAQYGRGVGIVQAAAAQLMAQFAEALKAQLAAGANEVSQPQTPDAATAPAAVKPISGMALLLRAVWNSLVKSLTGRVPRA